jgi:drug/metabolite transporter (DMT)-like permease|tara:strand:- start:3947 stop:4804 length:858 start_codon:yes stop_codon:yes gene_type:complete
MLASKGIFAKQLYSLGVDFETVAATRSALAVPGFVVIAFVSGSFRGGVRLKRSHAAAAIGAGLICYYLGSMANFYALTLIDASVERALLFTYPALVILLGVLLGLESLTKSTMVALLTTFSGIALVIGIDADALNTDLGGALWVFFCATTIAIYFLVNAKLSPEMGSAMFTLLAMGAAGAAFAAHYELRHGWIDLSLSAEAWAWLGGLILVATIVPLSLIAEGLRRIGSQRAAFASTIGPPAAAVMAVVFLDEEITALQLLGIMVVVSSIVYLEVMSQRSSNISV